MSPVREVLVLGGGPAGLWAALSLLESHPGLRVRVIEREGTPGGMAAGFTEHDLTYDLGSHRLHPSSAGRILDSVRSLLGDRLLERPRNGRILLEGRFVRFPLKPADMLLRLPPSFAAGVALDALSAPFRRPAPPDAPFDATLRAGLGRTICERFYFPYARKLWGLPPDRIDGVQARRRVSAGSLGKMLRKVASGVRRSSGTGGVFYYPAGGFGEIFTAAAARIERLGGEMLLRAEVTEVTPPAEGRPGSVVVSTDGRSMEIPADFLFSTLPVTDLVRMIRPGLDGAVIDAAGKLGWRAMVLLYLELDTRSYTPFDAHYFPGPETVFSRLSEPRNYSMAEAPAERTGLCLEIPCTKGEALWEMSDEELSALAAAQLVAAGLPRPPILAAFTRRLGHAYPSYTLDYSRGLTMLEDSLEGIPGLVSIGRQGLFAHDNTHHAMETGVAAAGCLDPDAGWAGWDARGWAEARIGFREHTVVD